MLLWLRSQKLIPRVFLIAVLSVTARPNLLMTCKFGRNSGKVWKIVIVLPMGWISVRPRMLVWELSYFLFSYIIVFLVRRQFRSERAIEWWCEYFSGTTLSKLVAIPLIFLPLSFFSSDPFTLSVDLLVRPDPSHYAHYLRQGGVMFYPASIWFSVSNFVPCLVKEDSIKWKSSASGMDLDLRISWRIL